MAHAAQGRILATIGVLVLTLAAGCAAGKHTREPSGTLPGESRWQLIWSEEFEGPAIDQAIWTHETFAGIESGNRELQHYTDRPVNSYIEDGRLVIRAQREEYKGHDFTSARMTTAKSFAFQYGRVEARIRIPSTKGIWPAFWMMPRDSVYGGWPHSGEIDIMESVNLADETYGTIHYANPRHAHTGGAFKLPPQDGRHPLMSEDFHVFAIEWEPREIRWYVDGTLFSTKSEWMTVKAPFPAPFNQDFFLILNVAVGGNWPGPPDETSEFPQTMEVDWIRVYQMDNEFPEMRVVAPEEGAILPARQPIEFLVEAHDSDGQITHVDLVRGREVLATANAAPYRLTIDGLADGCHEDLALLAFDDAGVSTRQPVMLTIGTGCPQGPFGGTPIVIPGQFEAEHFDEGWREEAYHDQDPSNNGGQFRPNSGVDIGSAGADMFYVGWTEAGEWIEYTVDVAEAGEYALSARVAAGLGGGTFRLADMAGERASAAIRVRSTGDWNSFVIANAEGTLRLSKGQTILRLHFEDGGVNVDWLGLARTAE